MHGATSCADFGTSYWLVHMWSTQEERALGSRSVRGGVAAYVILESGKVGGSTPPLTTSSLLR